jgi:hypothetical protein
MPSVIPFAAIGLAISVLALELRLKVCVCGTKADGKAF